MSPLNTLSFDDTAVAFEYKSDPELRKSRFLFSMMGSNFLVKNGAYLAELAIKWGLPVKGIIRSTIFEQFVGGETLTEVHTAVGKLARFHVGVILDYGAEAKETESDFDMVRNEFIRVLDFAAKQDNVPYIAIKITALGRFALLEKLNEKVIISDEGFTIDTSGLTETETKEWRNIQERVEAVCRHASQNKIGILIDAEESWIQNTIDYLALLAMQQLNQTEAIVLNTIQLYRSDRLGFLKTSLKLARLQNYISGAKIVRGAYMEKERKRATETGAPSPIQPDKAASDRDFNAGIELCLKNLDHASLIVASHNEQSVKLAAKLMTKQGIEKNHPRVHFSQLFGMSDNITFNLARNGYNTSKYVPYGPIADVVPYLMRRAQENSSVAGQTGRELFLIKKELERRKGK